MNITVDPTKTRAQLLQHVQPFKMSHKIYELGQITNEWRLSGYTITTIPVPLQSLKINIGSGKETICDRNKTPKLADIE
jgi:hypothetical protein